MVIGDRIRGLRQQKKLSQGDLAQLTGLTRNHISQIEKNFTVPLVRTLERVARGLQVPIYRLLYEGKKLPDAPSPVRSRRPSRAEWEDWFKTTREWAAFRSAIGRMDARHRLLLLHLTREMARR